MPTPPAHCALPQTQSPISIPTKSRGENFSPRDYVIYSTQFPVNMDDATGSRIVPYMADLNALNYGTQYFRCQFCNVRIIFDRGIYFSSLHTFSKCLYLLQDIRIQHIMIYPVCLWTDLRMRVMIHTQVYICNSLL